MKKKILQSVLLCSVLSGILIACEDDDPVGPSIVQEWSVPLSAKHENPAPAGRTETGTATIQLLSDNTIKYTIAVNGLAAGDALTAAHIHVGDVVTNGGVILGFDPVFNGTNATGIVSNIRTTFIDSLKNNVNELYFNVHSTQVPSGLVRGQINTGIDFAIDVALSGTNQVPPVTTTATGIALLRLTTDKKLYSKVTVTNLEPADALLLAHIHKAAVGVNGPVIIDLSGSAADFGVSKVSTPSDANITSLKTEAVYVNTHSVNHPAGLIRGQIR